MFIVILVPFDVPVVVSHHSFVPLSLVALFHCFDILTESFSFRISHITAIVRNFIFIAMLKMNLNTRISAYVLYTFQQLFSLTPYSFQPGNCLRNFSQRWQTVFKCVIPNHSLYEQIPHP